MSPQERCPYCGDGPCPHPWVKSQLFPDGCSGPHGPRSLARARMLAEWAWNQGRNFAADEDGAVPETVHFWKDVPSVLKDEVFVPTAARFLNKLEREFPMTKKVRIENADATLERVIVEVWFKGQNGAPDTKQSERILPYPCNLADDLYVYSGCYLVVKEAPPETP